MKSQLSGIIAKIQTIDQVDIARIQKLAGDNGRLTAQVAALQRTSEQNEAHIRDLE